MICTCRLGPDCICEDPITEIVDCCEECGGDGGHPYPIDINRNDGSVIEGWDVCGACEGKGSIIVEIAQRTDHDLDDEDYCGFMEALMVTA